MMHLAATNAASACYDNRAGWRTPWNGGSKQPRPSEQSGSVTAGQACIEGQAFLAAALARKQDVTKNVGSVTISLELTQPGFHNSLIGKKAKPQLFFGCAESQALFAEVLLPGCSAAPLRTRR